MQKNIAKEQNKAKEQLIWEKATRLKKEILSIQLMLLEESLNPQKVLTGELKPSDSIKKFFTTLYDGNYSRLSIRKERFVD